MRRTLIPALYTQARIYTHKSRNSEAITLIYEIDWIGEIVGDATLKAHERKIKTLEREYLIAEDKIKHFDTESGDTAQLEK